MRWISVTGQYLGIGAGESPAEYVQPDLRDRVFLVGDAGGFVDPLTGEGIYGALLSGQAAAKAILAEMQGKDCSGGICRLSQRTIGRRCAFLSRAAAAFYANPSPRISRHAVALRAQVHGQDLHPWTQRQEPGHADRTVTVLKLV